MTTSEPRYTPVDFTEEERPRAAAPKVRPGKNRKGLLLTVVGGVVVIAVAAVVAVLVFPSSPKTHAQIGADLQHGAVLSQSGDAAGAITQFQQVISESPKDFEVYAAVAHFDIGAIHQANGDLQDAITSYEAAIQLAPRYTAAMYNLAIALTPSNPTLAAQYYQQILSIKPGDANTLFNLGLLTYDSGNHGGGIAYLKAAIKVDPSFASKVPANIKIPASTK
jgi:tetratricopeptide (TPR) repeat protein